MFAVRSPTVILLVAIHAAAAAVLLSLWVICSSPVLGVRFESGRTPDEVEMRTPSGQVIAHLAADTPVVFRGRDAVVVETADALRTMFLPSGRPAGQAQWYAARTRLKALALDGEVRVEAQTAEGPVSLQLAPKARSLRDINLEAWIILLAGLAPALIAAWLWALRPRDWAARCYGVSGVTLMVMCHTAAIWQAKGPAADGTVLWGVSIVNFVVSEINFWALAAMFMRFPKPLVRPRAAYLLLPAACMVAGALGPAYLGLKLVFPTIMVGFVAAVVLCIAQWRASREDPVARAILSWFGLAILGGASIAVAAFVAPRLGGGPPLVPNIFGVLPILITYIGVAIGVGRYRLFDLDRWSYQVLAIAVAAAALLALDGVLVTLLQVQPRTALGLSIALIAVLYVPMRGLLWRALAGKAAPVDSALFQRAAEVAFTSDPEARRAAWRGMLDQLFQPLQMEPASGDHEAPSIGGHGLELIAPAAAGEGPLVLRYLNGGRRLFNAEHLALVRELTSFMTRAEGARDSYRRGVLEERTRIARDLHDDVGARLLSGLHRTDPDAVRSDVRAALADMRTLVADLVGQDATIERLLGDLRRETAERLEQAGVELDWPVLDDPPERTVAHGVYRHLRSAFREVISNALKHAKATCVTVRVEHPAGRLRLTISDNGIGFAGQAGPGQGVGLGSLRQRLQQIGGSATIGDGETGARVVIEAPV